MPASLWMDTAVMAYHDDPLARFMGQRHKPPAVIANIAAYVQTLPTVEPGIAPGGTPSGSATADAAGAGGHRWPVV